MSVRFQRAVPEHVPFVASFGRSRPRSLFPNERGLHFLMSPWMFPSLSCISRASA